MLVAVAVVTPLLRLAGHAQETAYLGASALGLNSLAPLEPATHARDSGVAVAMSTRERLARPPPTPTPPSESPAFQCCRATQQTTEARTCRRLCQEPTDPTHPRSLTAPPDSPASLLLSADIASPIQGAGCYRAHLSVEIPLTTHARGRALPWRSPSLGRVGRVRPPNQNEASPSANAKGSNAVPARAREAGEGRRATDRRVGRGTHGALARPALDDEATAIAAAAVVFPLHPPPPQGPSVWPRPQHGG